MISEIQQSYGRPKRFIFLLIKIRHFWQGHIFLLLLTNIMFFLEKYFTSDIFWMFKVLKYNFKCSYSHSINIASETKATTRWRKLKHRTVVVLISLICYLIRSKIILRHANCVCLQLWIIQARDNVIRYLL